MKKILFIIIGLIVLGDIASAQTRMPQKIYPPWNYENHPVAPMFYFVPDGSDSTVGKWYFWNPVKGLDSIEVNLEELNALTQSIETNTDTISANVQESNVLAQANRLLLTLANDSSAIGRNTARVIQGLVNSIKDRADTTNGRISQNIYLLQQIRARVDSIQYGTSSLISETLDDSPTSITSSGVKIGNRNKVSFILAYDETEVGNSVSGTLTIEVSPDNTNWYTYDIIYDHTGSIVSSIAYTSDANDIFYLPELVTFPYMRVKFVGTNTDSDDTILITVIMCWQGK